MEGDVQIVNMFGQLISSYKAKAGTDRIDIDCTQLASGIYYTSLVVHGKIEKTMKLVITK